MPQIGETALMLAARNGHVEAVSILLDRGASIEHQDMVRYMFVCCVLVMHSGIFIRKKTVSTVLCVMMRRGIPHHWIPGRGCPISDVQQLRNIYSIHNQ